MSPNRRTALAALLLAALPGFAAAAPQAPDPNAVPLTEEGERAAELSEMLGMQQVDAFGVEDLPLEGRRRELVARAGSGSATRASIAGRNHAKSRWLVEDALRPGAPAGVHLDGLRSEPDRDRCETIASRGYMQSPNDCATWR